MSRRTNLLVGLCLKFFLDMVGEIKASFNTTQIIIYVWEIRFTIEVVRVKVVKNIILTRCEKYNINSDNKITSKLLYINNFSQEIKLH